MSANLVHWPESYSDLYSSMGDNDSYVESGDVEFDMRYSSITTDPADDMGFVHSVSIILIQA
jgi:hypothetical protein